MGLLIIFMQKAIGQGIGILYGALGEILTEKSGNLNPVSYTHLTLPTISLV